MAFFYTGEPIFGAATQDYIFGYLGSALNNTLNGLAGNDFILGDVNGFYSSASGNSDSTSAQSIDDSSIWSTTTSDLVDTGATPHVTLYGSGEGQEEWFSITVGAGETITVDIDFATFDSFVAIFDSSGAGPALASNDDSTTNMGGAGSVVSTDSYLSYTVATAGTYYIAVSDVFATNIGSGEQFIMNVSVSGHGATSVIPSGDDQLFGGDGNDMLIGEGGDDFINGDNGNDTLFGGAGDDSLYAGAGDNQVFGGDGDDTYNEDTGNGIDVVDMGAGNDILVVKSNTFAAGESFDGGAGVDTFILGITMTQAAGYTIDLSTNVFYANVGGPIKTILNFENVTGDVADDTIIGNAGNNRIFGDAGDDTITGGDGHDFIEGGVGNDIMDGGDGIDTLSYFNATSGIQLNLGQTTAQNTLASGMDTVSNFEYLIGSSFDDFVYGANGENKLNLNDGNDYIVHVGTAKNRYFAEAGDDTISFTNFLGANGSVFDGGTGTDTLLLTAGGVTSFDFRFMTLTGFEEVIFGNTLNGDTVMLLLASQYAFSTVTAQAHAGYTKSVKIVMDGQATLDISTTTFTGFTEAGDKVNIVGSAISETITGSSIDDLISAAGGDDVVNGGAGDDTIYTGSGTNSANGDAGNDTIIGADGVDTLNGGVGSDALFGQDGNDVLDGGDGDDHVEGGNGNDTLRGGAGIDTVSGGNGDDTLYGGDGLDSMYGGAGNDTINGDGGNDVIIAATGNDTINGGIGDDLIYTGAGADLASGNEGDDTILGGNEVDNISGNAGNDIIYGFGGNDFLYGDDGNDFISGGDGNDSGQGGLGSDTISGGAGDDNFNGGEGTDLMYGGTGYDILRGEAGNDTLFGGDGPDTLFGGTGDDRLYAQSGDNNDLYGEAGDDQYFGGTGRDLFHFDKDDGAATERVSFFQSTDDVVLTNFGFANAGAAASSFSQSGNNVVFNNSGITIVFYGAVLAEVQAAVIVNSNAELPSVDKHLVSEDAPTLDQDIISEFLNTAPQADTGYVMEGAFDGHDHLTDGNFDLFDQDIDWISLM